MKYFYRQKNKFFLGVILMLGLFTATCIAQEFYGIVVGVSDGDTIKVLTQDKKEVKVRLYGIDCPEKKQDFGMVAKKFTSDLVFGKNVKVIEKDLDRYGRTIGIVFVDESIELNSEILKAGLAWWYKKYSLEREDYRRFEEKAKVNKLGLWQIENAINPEQFRKNKKKN